MKKIFDLVNKIENQYLIRLAKTQKPAVLNRVTAPSIKTWHTWMGHLSYNSLLQLLKLALGVEIKRSVLKKISDGCMKDCMQ